MKKKKIIKKKTQKKAKVVRKVAYTDSRDLPVTQKMLYGVRSELKADIRSLEKKMDSRFNLVESRFNEQDARFARIDARFNEQDAKFARIDARFNEIDARFDKMEARFKDIDARFDKMEARFNDIDAKISVLTSEIHRLAVIVEEQNNRNKIVLDALHSLFQRQERLENHVNQKLSDFEKMIMEIRK